MPNPPLYNNPREFILNTPQQERDTNQWEFKYLAEGGGFPLNQEVFLKQFPSAFEIGTAMGFMSLKYFKYDYNEATFETFKKLADDWLPVDGAPLTKGFNSSEKPRRAIETMQLIHQFMIARSRVKREENQIDDEAGKAIAIFHLQASHIQSAYFTKKKDFSEKNPILGKIINIFENFLGCFIETEAKKITRLFNEIKTISSFPIRN